MPGGWGCRQSAEAAPGQVRSERGKAGFAFCKKGYIESVLIISIQNIIKVLVDTC